MKYAVVTRVPPTTEAGNMAVALDIYVQVEEPGPGNDYRGKLESAIPYLGAATLALRRPVFALGEVLILDGEHGRELAGHGRKPSKWDVQVEYFDDARAACARGNQAIEDDAKARLEAEQKPDPGEAAEDPQGLERAGGHHL